MGDVVAFITGGGSGIGKGVAKELWNRGHIIVVGDINFDSAKEVAKELDPGEKRTFAVLVDVTKGVEVNGVVSEILARFGRVDILVNNAGISLRKKTRRVNIAEIEEEEWEHVLDVNLKGMFNCAKAVMADMMRNRFGKIVNISSTVGISGGLAGPAGAHYAASKAGVIAFTKALAGELAPFGINVNAIAPGRIAGTGLTLSQSQEVMEGTRKDTPIGRLGKVEDVAKLVAFLVSEDASFIVGETIVIDGGKLLVRS